MSRLFNRKNIIIKLILALLFILSNVVLADGWIQTEFGNWQYIENGEPIRATNKVIDGVNYYFDTKGNWIPREEIKRIKMVGKEDTNIHFIGKDTKNRNYDTILTLPMPIVSGENELAINEYIRKEFPNVIRKYFEEHYIDAMFLMPKIKLNEVIEIYNMHDVIAFGYFGAGMFNVYLDYKEMKMWAVNN